MSDAKYIILDNGFNCPVIFPAMMDHGEVARQHHAKPKSAGFFRLYVEDGEIKVNVFGRSSSLNLTPDEQDGMLIAQALRIGQFEY